MKKRNLTIILFILTSVSSYCQISPDIFLKELKQKKVDTICVFDDYSVGSYQVYNEKTIKDYCKFEPTYFFWKESGKTFLTKKDSCFEYSTIEIDADKIWKNYLENEKAIKLEKVKRFQFIEMINGKKNILTTMIDHSHHQNFKIIIKDQITEKRFDDFDLQEFDSEKKTNINYKRNVILKSKTLLDEIGKLIMKYERFIVKKKD